MSLNQNLTYVLRITSRRDKIFFVEELRNRIYLSPNANYYLHRRFNSTERMYLYIFNICKEFEELWVSSHGRLSFSQFNKLFENHNISFSRADKIELFNKYQNRIITARCDFEVFIHMFLEAKCYIERNFGNHTGVIRITLESFYP